MLTCCFVAYGLTAGGHFGSTDEEDLFQNTLLLASLAQPLTGFPDSLVEEPPSWRSPQEIGLSLVALPWLWTLHPLTESLEIPWRALVVRAGMTLLNIAITLLTVWAIYLWTSRWIDTEAGLWTALLYGLATMAWPYSQTFYREPLTALCLCLAFGSASQFRLNQKPMLLILSTAAIGMAILTKSVAIVALPWWLLIGYRKPLGLRPNQWLLMTILSLLIGAVGLVGLDIKWQILQNYLSEMKIDLRFSQHSFVIGLVGLLLSPGKGLLLVSPPVILGLWGICVLWRRYPQDTLALGGLIVTFIVIYSTRRGWHGGACWGPRYLLPVLPLMMPFVAATLSHQSSERSGRFNRLRRFSIILTTFVVGFLIQVGAVSIFPPNYYQLKADAGVVGPKDFQGGSLYMAPLYFSLVHSPVLGHVHLTQNRMRSLELKSEPQLLLPTMPPGKQIWYGFAQINTLDYWWVYWRLFVH
ncbi:MAG: hypothetical protein AAF702_16630 [Chloroflexota bacterium]